MKAVRLVDLSEAPERQALRHPMLAPIAWTALTGGVLAAGSRLAMSQPAISNLIASMAATGVQTSIWVVHLLLAGLSMSDPLIATSRAFGRALATPEGSLALLIMTATSAMSLAILRRLLTGTTQTGAS